MAKILIIDDAPFFRLMLRDLLALKGHEILLAEDGEQGSNMALEHGKTLDLVVLDMVLPKKTGLEVLMDIVDLKLKILCATGNEMVEEIDELKELGASDVINKSAPVEEIIYRINHLMFGAAFEAKRQHPRALVTLQITYRWHDAAGEQVATSSTFTLSDQGVFIQSPTPLPKDTDLHLTFFLPLSSTAGKEIDCKARVVRVDQASGPGTVSGMGIAFVDVPAFDRQIISDYVQSLGHKPGA